ncbi:MAG TPA: hypothetical protein VJ729_17325 [Nitrososphaeraceae archaeon]|nr:hypothetical protein [Nitrososphaeraceae archaeon]
MSRNRWFMISAIIFVIFFHNWNLGSPVAYAVASNVDKFGIKEIYATKPGGEEWFMNMQDPTADPRFDPQANITKNPDGSYKMTEQQVRMEVYPSTGYHEDQITTLNQKELAARGYMQSPNDWKNVEMTGIVKLISSLSNDQFNWYNRGGRHTNSAPCEGTAYKSDVMYYSSRQTRFNKEQWFSGGYSFTSPKNVSSSSIQGKWVGLKYIVYNFHMPDGKTAVMLQSWFDANADGKWIKINEFVDSGGWGHEGSHCGGAPDQLITWGGPIATFRWDNATNVDFKNLSVREIEPPAAP